MNLPPRGSQEDMGLRQKLGFHTNTKDANFVSSWIAKLILYSASQAANRCPGLSVEDCRFLQLYDNANTWVAHAEGGMSLIETKIVAAKFLTSGAFTDRERFLPALFASADSNSRLSETGDDILKHATPAISFEDSPLLDQIFEIYLGTRGMDGSLPAKAPLQMKILTLLCRSQRASSYTSQNTRIVEEGLALSDEHPHGAGTNTTKLGLESSKLRSRIFAYLNWIARTSETKDLELMSPLLVSKVRAYIENQGWPRYNGEESGPSDNELRSRSLGYESIGILAKASPGKLLYDTNLDLLRWLFSSLSSDSTGKDVSMSIEQALASVLSAFGNKLESELEQSLTSLLLHHMNLTVGEIEGSNFQVVRSTRFTAVKFANRCLSYGNPKARWVDLLAIGGTANERNEVVEEGRKGLDPYWYRMLNPVKSGPGQAVALSDAKYELPTFVSMTRQIFGSDSLWAVSKSRDSPLLASNAYGPAVNFVRSILLHQALESNAEAPSIDADWERKLEVLVSNNEQARVTVTDFLRRSIFDYPESQACLRDFLLASLRGMVYLNGDAATQCGKCLLQLCSLSPDSLVGDVAPEVAALQEAIFSSHKPLRETASRCFGILASHNTSPTDMVNICVKLFDQKCALWTKSVGTTVLQVHGAILSKAYLLSRISLRQRTDAKHEEAVSGLSALVIDIFQNSKDKMLTEAGIVAFSELVLSGTLRLEASPLSQQASNVIQILQGFAKDGNEKAINALGIAAMQCTERQSEKSILDQIINILYDLHNIREPAVQFAVGEALSRASAGFNSKSLIGSLDIGESTPQTPNRNTTLPSVLDEVFEKGKTTKPALIQASVIWLLCLVQFCGHLQEVQTKLRNCQSFFKDFLADRDSLNQESASRGLSLVYEKGDRAIKDDLVKDLVSSFTGTGASLAGTVSAETELFEPGALPTGESSSITTYKDIMSLASEVGNPSLVYRFMSLAANNAIWSSRAAFGRFGLSNVFSDSSIDGYLAQHPKLYPALFRYRFDPNTNVRNSMNEIWIALVKEPAVIIDLHFDSIMSDLLKNIVGKEWRSRQACCAAISDLVQGQPQEKYEKYISDIWTMTFKVCDDIKESVRSAATALARVLVGVLTRRLESSSRGAGTMLRTVLPFLLSPSGLENPAQDVQAFSLSALLQIIKKSTGTVLRPFIPDLIGRLILLLSSLEPQGIEYVRLRAEQYGVTGQQIDDARLSSVRGSPMLEAIERCLDFLDEQTMSELQNPLKNAITTALGLPSRVGGGRVLVSLSTRHNVIFKPYADRFLRLARKQVLDRNDTISASYAAACGYLARLTSEEETLNLIQHCYQLYFDSDEERHRIVSSDILFAFSKHATDRFNSLNAETLPLIFVAKHDTNERVRDLFQKTWDENVGGSRTVLLYMQEIIELSREHLMSARWSLKHTAALSIADAVESLGTEISDTAAEIIWPAIEKAVDGKSWEGKEKVLKAFVKFAKSSNSVVRDREIQNRMQVCDLIEVHIYSSHDSADTFHANRKLCYGRAIGIMHRIGLML